MTSSKSPLAPLLMTLSILQGHSLISSLFKRDHQYSEMLAVDHYCSTRDENSADRH